jgi:hypothetical protein
LKECLKTINQSCTFHLASHFSFLNYFSYGFPQHLVPFISLTLYLATSPFIFW